MLIVTIELESVPWMARTPSMCLASLGRSRGSLKSKNGFFPIGSA